MVSRIVVPVDVTRAFSESLSKISQVRALVRVYRVDRDINAERNQERVEGRMALQLLSEELGEPMESEVQFPHPRFSLSHTGNYRAVCGLVSGDARVSGIGIDLELARRMSERIGKFFLNDDEFARLGTPPEEASLLRVWTVKEALFKSDPDNSGHVLRHYVLTDPSMLEGTACATGTAKKFWYASQPFEGGWLSLAACLKET